MGFSSDNEWVGGILSSNANVKPSILYTRVKSIGIKHFTIVAKQKMQKIHLKRIHFGTV